MNDQEINDLLNRYREGICTAAEKKAVEAWYNALDYKHTLTVEEFESAKERSWKKLNPIYLCFKSCAIQSKYLHII